MRHVCKSGQEQHFVHLCSLEKNITRRGSKYFHDDCAFSVSIPSQRNEKRRSPFLEVRTSASFHSWYISVCTKWRRRKKRNFSCVVQKLGHKHCSVRSSLLVNKTPTACQETRTSTSLCPCLDLCYFKMPIRSSSLVCSAVLGNIHAACRKCGYQHFYSCICLKERKKKKSWHHAC